MENHDETNHLGSIYIYIHMFLRTFQASFTRKIHGDGLSIQVEGFLEKCSKLNLPGGGPKTSYIFNGTLQEGLGKTPSFSYLFSIIQKGVLPENHGISKLVVWRSQTPAIHIQTPL